MSRATRFEEARNKALFSMDRDTILAYMKKHGIRMPSSELAFWAGVHKCICTITNAPPELKEQSRNWLLEHNMRPEIWF